MAEGDDPIYDDLVDKVKYKLKFLKNSNKITVFSLHLEILPKQY